MDLSRRTGSLGVLFAWVVRILLACGAVVLAYVIYWIVCHVRIV